MELNSLDAFYDKLQEPTKSCLLAIRQLLLSYDTDICELKKYGLPFFYYKKKAFCYLWKDKKSQEPYIGIHRGYLIEHPKLIKGTRTRIKIFPIHPEQDIDKDTLFEILDLAKLHYK
ncbi:DUF1801 domain-containing protein [Flavicella sediminum]|uniref:DUF1801 domain-containing protein n=1 Tax=Flavicella sediminum TaxID=2585141 RepID=UPI00112319BE|nr:DUF1801 domain-containing protein [Flavicella sediminum]